MVRAYTKWVVNHGPLHCVVSLTFYRNLDTVPTRNPKANPIHGTVHGPLVDVFFHCHLANTTVMKHQRIHSQTKKEFGSSWTSSLSSQDHMLHESFTSTPSFGLLAMQTSPSIPDNCPTGDHAHEETLSIILDDCHKGDHNREFDMAPNPHGRHETSTALHFSFEESLEICFGMDESAYNTSSPDPRQSADTMSGYHKRLVSPEPSTEDRPMHKTPTTPSFSFGHGSASPVSIGTRDATFDRSRSEIPFVSDDIRRRRSMRLERSLNHFSPHKHPMLDSSVGMDVDVNMDADGERLLRSPDCVEMLDLSPAIQCQPSYVETSALNFPDGRRFIGQHMGKQNLVQGVMTYLDGTVFRGSWREGRRHGRGTVRFPDGSTYHGDFEGGEYHGKGKMTWSDGGYYVGMWNRGHVDGEGIEVRADGSIRHDGIWKKGRPCRDGRLMITPESAIPKIIHAMKWPSTRSVDSESTLGTSLSKND